ncbi:hypothetical protein [Paludifilum halophilum]|uniref:Gram-positive cocci surface proteins LPxTG domain-containing protein n=1 Tax=Paludifilum halophilum TaxID=1642702 RepID=A0A235B2S0_9BACL|nr:hypothetical protein [Paludifilum halophilum]OYD06583.1 hypothetical protein CHM34_15945 [Paludifilum halophilum]
MVVKRKAKVTTVASVTALGLMVANPVYASPSENIEDADTGVSVEAGLDEGLDVEIQSPDCIPGLPCDEDPGEEPGDNPGEEPGDNPGEEPGDNPGEEPGDHPGEEPGDNPGEEPGDHPGDNPGEEPGDNPGEPGDNPGEEPGDNPGEEPGDNPGEEPGDNPGEEPGDNPGEEPGDNPGEEPGDDPDNVIETPTPTDPPKEERPESVGQLENAKDQQKLSSDEKDGDNEEEEGKEMPDTSTSYPIQLAGGLMSALAGGLLLFARRLRIHKG